MRLFHLLPAVALILLQGCPHGDPTPPTPPKGYSLKLNSNAYTPCDDVPAYHHEDPIGGEDGSAKWSFFAKPVALDGKLISDPTTKRTKALANCSHSADPTGVYMLRTRVWASNGQIIAGADQEISVSQAINVKYQFKPGKTGDAADVPEVQLTNPGAWNATVINGPGNFVNPNQTHDPFKWKLDGEAAEDSRLASISVNGKDYPLGNALGQARGCSAFQICHFHRHNGQPQTPPLPQCPVMVQPCPVTGTGRPDDLPPLPN